MSFLTRAWLYVIRKRGKSALLFVLFLIIATFVLTGLSITKATGMAQQQVRESFGAKFSLLTDYSRKNPYIKNQQTDRGDIIYYNEKPITQEVVDKILSVSGIKSHEIIAGWMPLVQNIELVPGSVDVDESLRRTSSAKATSDSSSSSFFTSGELTLVAGRHLTPEDKNSVLISKELAEINGLKVGDSITVSNEKGKNEINMTIIGLFEPKSKTDDTGKTFTFSKIENMLLSDMASRDQFFQGESGVGFDQVRFYVSDPKQMDDIIKKAKEIPGIDWRAYTMEVDNTTYNNAATSLESLDKLISTLLIVIILASAVVLSLILTMWAKSRIHETGVLLTFGIGKTKILLQYITEAILIAVLAFGLSYFSGSAIANSVGNSMLEQQASQNGTAAGDDNKRGGVAVGVEEPVPSGGEVESIDVHIGYDDLLRLYLIGLCIIILSVGISSITVMRLKPREILSKMS